MKRVGSKFQIGDKIKVVKDLDVWLDQGSKMDQVFTVVEDNGNDDHAFCPLSNTAELCHILDWPDDFELLSRPEDSGMSFNDQKAVEKAVEEPEVVVPLVLNTPLGAYRPNLEDRKVGKVRVELVDKGFPNALWEVARLMTKAQEVKGYVDHDWKNLPNWRESFPAAASRHRMKHNKGELYDDEFEDFNLLHKVNEAFNVLAELELLLVVGTK